MAPKSLRFRILISFGLVVMAVATMIALLGYFVLQRDIIERAEAAVLRDLQTARKFYEDEIRRIGESLEWILGTELNGQFSEKADLDYVAVVSLDDMPKCTNEIVLAAFEEKQGAGGTRMMGLGELETLDRALADAQHIKIKSTPMARPTLKTELKQVLVKEYAVPMLSEAGEVQKVLYGGRVINLDFQFVDRIRNLVFGSDLYDGTPIGTVTIFQDDVRVATNVLDERGERAVGTRVSEVVYTAVVEEGQVWHDRAFVVTDWYKTAYEPIQDIQGNIVGILYVGILEQPYNDLAGNILIMFLTIVAGCALLAVILSMILAMKISRPLTEIVKATTRLSEGQLGYEVDARTQMKELNTLAIAFNGMSTKLKAREESLRISNDKLVEANQSYVHLISFVAHELKGVLASAVMNTYSVRDGFLGMVNFKQRKAIDSVARNLDYLTNIVRKFLNLGRIERGELSVNRTSVKLWGDVFKVSLEALSMLAERRSLKIESTIDEALEVQADLDLLQIVANNLVSNAIKYCQPQGQVTLTSRAEGDVVRIEVYNDSTPIPEAQKVRLFQKFSRLETEETRREKGTGLGLFITRQIIEAHGGTIWVQAQEQGNSFIFEISKGASRG
ncbi:MAG: cache domain-containing protein [Phycisphaeraceae bacterium]|nr:cache domain-containing protein [Phycisphaeraceae bacterium]